MYVSVVPRVVSATARPLCAGLALALALLCALLGVAAPTPSTTGMTGMTGIVSAAGVSGLDDMGEATAAAAMTMGAGRDGGPTLASTCETPCVTDIGGACTIAAGLAVTALSALFLASRRDTFLGLFARLGPLFYTRRRRRDPTPWTVLSLSSLCVLRV